MGADYTAYALIGVRVDPKKLRELSSCEHQKPADASFCPKCGKPVGTYDADESSICGYDVVHGTDGSKAFICMASSGHATYSNGGPDCDMKYLPMEAMKLAKDNMRIALTPLGLWDEQSFGLWAVLQCSY